MPVGTHLNSLARVKSYQFLVRDHWPGSPSQYTFANACILFKWRAVVSDVSMLNYTVLTLCDKHQYDLNNKKSQTRAMQKSGVRTIMQEAFFAEYADTTPFD